MKISKRLKAISNFIDDNSNIIDVGCDHALLDIYLFNSKKNVKLIASDVKKGPLEQAKKNIEKYGCNDIKVKLGNGIDTIEDYIDTVVISGMGGDTIIDILDNGKDKLSNVKNMVIAPQSEWCKTRKFICDLGYIIEDETIIEDSSKFYLIIKFISGNRKYNNKELEYGPILLQNKSIEFKKYYNLLLEEKIKILKKVPKFKIVERFKYKRQINIIKKILKNR